MSRRLPVSGDFPTNIELTIIPPPLSQPPVNVLILLHGLGDTGSSFVNLGRQLFLPETACLVLRAPTPLPFNLGGYHWGDDIVFNQATGQMDFDAGFARTTNLIKKDVIQSVLIKKCGFHPRDTFLLGFGQGGMAGLSIGISLEQELGGVISIDGPLPASAFSAKSKSPILVLGGDSNTLITPSAVSMLRRAFEQVEYIKQNRVGDAMPRNREEMLPIMQFLARRLRSRQGVPEGSQEIS
ncbi:hypothetical protein MMC20_001002 [Loxospora ochrophaea]|nr:hypothetical protein [Loxospora ochrophaea]